MSPISGIIRLSDFFVSERKAKIMSEKFIPVGHRILLKPDVVGEKTNGGIYIPPESRRMQQLSTVVCTVIAMGPTCYNDSAHGETPWCKVGDKVHIVKHSGVHVEMNGKDHFVINDEDVLMRIE